MPGAVAEGWPPVTADDLRQVLSEAGVSPALAALPIDLGSARRTHVFVLDDLVVKLDQQDSGRLQREQSAPELLEATDLPVPRFVASGELASGRPWLVMTRLAGIEPTDASGPAHSRSTGVAVQLGDLARRLHVGVHPPGFGTWTRSDLGLVDDEHRRADILAGMAVDVAVVEREELDRLLDLMATTREALTTAPAEPVLAHRDLQPRNVLVGRTGLISGLLDFESSGGGDPAEDFNRIGLDWTTPGFAAFCWGYQESGVGLDDDFADRVAHHVLGWCLAIFAYLGTIVPESVRDARRAIDRVRRGQRPDLVVG